MVSVAISSGHGLYIRGARGNLVPPQLDEVDQARRVVDRVAELWGANGVSAKKFHDNTSTSQNQNLNTIVNWHNAQSRDYDVSVHFNAYQNTSKPMGVEVLYVTQQQLATDTSVAIAQAGTFINRGAKKRTDLAFLNGTSKPAILIETCFCDSTADSNLYTHKFETICKRIAEVIGQITIGAPPIEPPVEPEEPPPDQVTARVDMTIKCSGDVVVCINGEDFLVSGPGPEEPAKEVFPPNQQNIICTIFGGSSDPNDSAYAPYDSITDREFSCALPYKFQSTRPNVLVHNIDTDKDVVCQIRDVGPWLTDDNYWDTTNRPLAETCYEDNQPLPRGPNEGKVPNGAGIDITPAAARAIGLSGKGKVDWRFIEEGVETS